MIKNGSNVKKLSDLLKNLFTNLKMLNVSYLLENLQPTYFEGVKIQIWNSHLTILYSKPEFGNISPKIKISLDLLVYLQMSQIKRDKKQIWQQYIGDFISKI